MVHGGRCREQHCYETSLEGPARQQVIRGSAWPERQRGRNCAVGEQFCTCPPSKISAPSPAWPTISFWSCRDLVLTYACHELEDRSLRISKEPDHFLKALHERVVVTDGPSHSSSQTVAKIVIDVQLTR